LWEKEAERSEVPFSGIVADFKQKGVPFLRNALSYLIYTPSAFGHSSQEGRKFCR